MEFAKEVLIRVVATVVSVIIISILLDLLITKQPVADGTLKKPGCGCGGHSDDTTDGTVIKDDTKQKPEIDIFTPPGSKITPLDFSSIFNK